MQLVRSRPVAVVSLCLPLPGTFREARPDLTLETHGTYVPSCTVPGLPFNQQ